MQTFYSLLADKQQAIADSVLPDDSCQIQDAVSAPNQVFIWITHLLISDSAYKTLSSRTDCTAVWLFSNRNQQITYNFVIVPRLFCCPAGVPTILFPHFGLSVQHDTPIHATLQGEHLRPRDEQTHSLRFLQRSGPSVWEQQHRLVLVEISHIMW